MNHEILVFGHYTEWKKILGNDPTKICPGILAGKFSEGILITNNVRGKNLLNEVNLKVINHISITYQGRWNRPAQQAHGLALFFAIELLFSKL